MLRRLLIERLEAIVRESVKPLEKIDEIKILQVDGFLGGGGGSGNGNGSYNGSLSDQIVNSALRYRAQGPLIDKLLKEIGLPTGSIPQLSSGDLEALIDPTGGERPAKETGDPEQPKIGS
jgi:uncharacterized membrane protein YqiK